MSGLYTEEYGTGKTLVLVHGWAMHMGVWRNFAKNLAQKYRVICVDLPGHGKSATTPFSLENVIEELHRCTQGQVCHWIGWSMGALLVLEMARKYPQKVASVVLLAGSPCFVSGPNWPGMSRRQLTLFRLNVTQQPRETLLKFLALEVQGEPQPMRLLRLLRGLVAGGTVPDAQVLLTGVSILMNTDLRTVLAGLEVPCLLCLGEHDVLIPVSVEKSIRLLLPEVSVFVQRNAGHLLFLSHEQSVVDRLFDFID